MCETRSIVMNESFMRAARIITLACFCVARVLSRTLAQVHCKHRRQAYSKQPSSQAYKLHPQPRQAKIAWTKNQAEPSQAKITRTKN